MINLIKIPCPVCNADITVNVSELLKGVNFSCEKCSAVIGIHAEEQQAVQDVMKKFEALKKERQ